MAIGFTPEYQQDYPLDGMTPQAFLVRALETAEKMAWKIAYVSENGFIAYTDNGQFKWNAEVKITLKDDVAHLHSLSAGNDMVDFGKNKKTVETFLFNFEAVKMAGNDADIAAKYANVKSHFPTEGEDVLTLPPKTFKEKTTDFLSFFVPTKDFFVTPLLIDINIIVFVLMLINGVHFMLPSSESLINWGANFKPNTLNGEAWRLMTACFLHIGIIHLLMNMYALFSVGIMLEPLLGKTKFIVAYLLTGLTSSMTSLWWHDLTISAGASGAIFGLYGVFFALLTTNLIREEVRKPLLSSIGFFIIFNLGFGTQAGIDNAAHIGGLIGGVLIGYAFVPSLKKNKDRVLSYTTLGVVVAAVLITSFVVFQKLPRDMSVYTQKMEIFGENEQKALKIHELPVTTPTDSLLEAYQNTGIRYWKENVALMNDIEKLDLPDDIKKRNELLKKYSLARLAANELTYKSIAENTDRYNAQISGHIKDIDLIINELNAKK